MKTKILTMILVLGMISGLAQSASAASSADYTVLNNIKAINKIEVRGNVELFISDSPVGQVKVYNKYYSENALVQYKNGTLRITSYNAEKLIVWVRADDLRAVSAYDNAEIRSFGKLSKIEFTVELHNTASARLDLDAYAASITLRDHSKTELSGTVTQFGLSASSSSTVVKNDFNAEHLTGLNTDKIAAVNTDEITILE